MDREPRASWLFCATVVLTTSVVCVGCVSDFVFELPEDHPAQADASPSGPLDVPDPFSVRPPEATSANDDDKRHGMRGRAEKSGSGDDPDEERRDGHHDHGKGMR